MDVRKASLFVGIVASCVLAGAAFWCTAGVWIVKSTTVWRMRTWKEALSTGQVMRAFLSRESLSLIERGLAEGTSALSRCVRAASSSIGPNLRYAAYPTRDDPAFMVARKGRIDRAEP